MYHRALLIENGSLYAFFLLFSFWIIGNRLNEAIYSFVVNLNFLVSGLETCN